jgi:hypothetical protein
LLPPLGNARPAYHSYTTEAICLSIKMCLHAAVSFRGCQAVVRLLQDYLLPFHSTPAPNSAEAWLLRVGLYELTRPKERADDWIFLIDHTLQLGNWKCVVIVGVRRSYWEQLEEPLTHHDLTLLMLKPVASSSGDVVQQQLNELTQQVGAPLAVLSDEGADITKGIAQFRAKHGATLVLNDIAHKAALFLKQELLADERWIEFSSQCGKVQQSVKQMELGHLAPPTQKIKGRYMNLGPLIEWGVRMLTLLDTPEASRPANQNLSRLEAKLGWVSNFRVALVDWHDLQAMIEQSLQYLRVEGYHATAEEELRAALEPRTAAGERLVAKLLHFVREQSSQISAGRSCPASSEVLESLIGKGKRLQGQHSRNGFTKLILGMGAAVAKLTIAGVQEALEAIGHRELTAWAAQNLGRSLATQRRAALPSMSE